MLRSVIRGTLINVKVETRSRKNLSSDVLSMFAITTGALLAMPGYLTVRSDALALFPRQATKAPTIDVAAVMVLIEIALETALDVEDLPEAFLE